MHFKVRSTSSKSHSGPIEPRLLSYKTPGVLSPTPPPICTQDQQSLRVGSRCALTGATWRPPEELAGIWGSLKPGLEVWNPASLGGHHGCLTLRKFICPLGRWWRDEHLTCYPKAAVTPPPSELGLENVQPLLAPRAPPRAVGGAWLTLGQAVIRVPQSVLSSQSYLETEAWQMSSVITRSRWSRRTQPSRIHALMEQEANSRAWGVAASRAGLGTTGLHRAKRGRRRCCPESPSWPGPADTCTPDFQLRNSEQIRVCLLRLQHPPRRR